MVKMKIDTSACEFEMYKSLNHLPVKAVCGNYKPPKEVLIDGELWVLKKEYCEDAHYERGQDEKSASIIY